jgi:predicted acyltransferase
VIEVKNRRGWAFPLIVVGMNSIAAYLIAHLWEDFIIHSFHTNLGSRPFAILGAGLQPLLVGIAVILTYWLVLYWMFRRKIFLRI